MKYAGCTYLFKYILVEAMYMEARANVSAPLGTSYGTTYRSFNVYAGVHF
jgi:hypothetical protein